jgi:ribosomal-protein-alanine N-acetyltransferase
MVCEHDDLVVGYMIYELHTRFLDLLSFATRYRRRGIGRQMIDKLKSKLTSQRRSQIRTIVRETNLPAQLFFKANGFLATEVLKNHYNEDTSEDAYFMQYDYVNEAYPPCLAHRLSGLVQ